MFRLFLVSLFCIHSLIAAIEWEDPILLSDPSQSCVHPILSVDPFSGRAIVAWQRTTDKKIEVSLFNGSVWSEPVAISSDSAIEADEPSVGINQSGHAIVVWRSFLNSAESEIQASFFNGTTWSEPATLSNTTTVDAPSVSINPSNDTALAVWRTSRGFSSLQTAFFSEGSWEQIPSFNPRAFIEPSSIHLNENGVGIISWIDTDAASSSTSYTALKIYSSIYNGSWSGSVSLSSAPDSPIQSYAALSPLENQGGVIWSDLHNIKASYWNGTSWNPEIALEEGRQLLVDPKLCCHPSSPYLAAVWRGSEGVQGALFQGGVWSAPITLSAKGKNPNAVINPVNGDVLVAWTVDTEIQYAEFNSLSQSLILGLSSAGTSFSPPQIGIDANGNAFSVWSHMLEGKMVIQAILGTTP